MILRVDGVPIGTCPACKRAMDRDAQGRLPPHQIRPGGFKDIPMCRGESKSVISFTPMENT